MGRTKTQLKKIENPTYRHITFAKRKCGIIKKAYELSTLCDIDLALLIFSPAGKLFLFQGKNRLEEIVQHFIDLPEQQRGRLQDKELIQRIINKMNLETHLYHQFVMAGRRNPTAEMEELQNEIILCNSELEEIEREMSYFLRSPSCIQTVSEAEQHEMILKDTLKNVQFRKQILERFESFTTSEEPYYPMAIDPASNFMLGSSSYFKPNMTPQINVDPNTLMNLPGHSGFQPFSNQAQAFPETFQLSPIFLDGHQFPSQNVQNNEHNINVYMPQPHQFGQFSNTDLPSRMSTIEQGSAKMAAGQSQEGDPTMGCYGGAYSIPEIDTDDFDPFRF